MSNDKPTAIATIKFYPNKHVEVHLSSLKHITPRTLDIASNIMTKTYRGMKAKFIVEEHKKAREDGKDRVEQEKKDAEKWDKKEARRLAKATAIALDMPKGKSKDELKEKKEEEKKEADTTVKVESKDVKTK